MSSTITNICRNHQLVLPCGDFNARSTVFGDSQDNRLAKPFFELLDTNQLYVANAHGVITHVNHDKRGYDDSIIDYTLASPAAAHLVSRWKTVELFDSHHVGIVFDIAFEPSCDYGSHHVWNFSSCDWDDFRSSSDFGLCQ